MALKRPYSNSDKMAASIVSQFMQSGNDAHRYHLQITGSGSYAQHTAVGEFYDAIRGFADSFAEEYQGFTMKLLKIESTPAQEIKTKDDIVNHLNNLYINIEKTQEVMPCSALVNTLDEVKSMISSTRYKLVFLS